jgi:hypothetical protein
VTRGQPPAIDVHTLVGLLADDDRRRVFAALVLGATGIDAVLSASGLDAARAGKALSRLASAGLVTRGDDGGLVLQTDAFAAAAKDRPRPEPGPADADEVVLRRFVRDGRLVSIPAQRAKRMVILDRLAQEFEPGTRYSEQMVNAVIGRWHADTAALRRYLVDEGFLDRAGGQYWRAGGTVDT